MTNAEYRQRPEISNSDIGNYIYGGITYFMAKREIDKQQSGKEYFDLGEAFHCYLQEPDDFAARFCIADSKLSGLMLNYANARIKMDVSESQLTSDELHNLAYEASGFSISKDRVLERFESLETQEAYKELKNSRGKIVLDKGQEEVIKNMYSSVMSNPMTRSLYNPNVSTSVEIHNELPIFWEYPLVHKSSAVDDIYFVACKSRLDRVVIDKESKTVILVDLKTTSKPIPQFLHNYTLYRYYRQMAFYKEALNKWLEETPYKDWSIEPRMVAVLTHPPYTSKVFSIAQSDLEFGKAEFTSALEDLNWHLTNQIYIDRDTYLNVATELKLNDNSTTESNEGERAAGDGGKGKPI